jgi:EAL domain-containing protein (putative c-di-GMP-specific phosphodiesterase class I)
LTAQLEDSLRSDRFRLLYQPVVSATTGETEYYEVLLRMVGDDGRLIAPAAFLDTAERFGLAGRIDRWVVRHALARIEEAGQAGLSLALAVNLSASALADVATSDAIVADVQAAGAGGRRMLFEVSEAVVVAAISDAQRLAESLKAIGCRLAVDSFGAGLSSFAYLRHLSADLLKIDESFMWGLEGDAVGQTLVRSMIDLAHGLGISTVAKGVEQPGVRATLAGLGIDLVQGFGVAMPLEQPVAG